jgi:hypothetical protein
MARLRRQHGADPAKLPTFRTAWYHVWRGRANDFGAPVIGERLHDPVGQPAFD